MFSLIYQYVEGKTNDRSFSKFYKIQNINKNKNRSTVKGIHNKKQYNWSKL